MTNIDWVKFCKNYEYFGDISVEIRIDNNNIDIWIWSINHSHIKLVRSESIAVGSEIQYEFKLKNCD